MQQKNLPKKVGIIAGSGNGPLLAARYANALGIKIVSILLCDDNQADLATLSETSYSLGVGQTTKIFNVLHNENVEDIVLIGKINKDVIYNKKAFDLRALKLLAKMKMRDDSSFMHTIIGEFEKEGINVLDQTLFLRDYLPQNGILGKKRPGKSELLDIEFGFSIVRKLAAMEIGQTIVVKDRSVVAVESMEGSDNTIRRGCEIGGKGAVIVKVSRPNQDFRFDVPTIGLKTIQTAVEGKAAVLAMESGRTLFLEREEGVKLANSKKLAVTAHSDGDFL